MRRVLVLVSVAALAACSSSHRTVSTVEPETTAAPTAAASAAAAASPTPGGASATAGSNGAASPAATRSRGASQQPVPGSRPAAGAVSTPAGTYTYDSHGTSSFNGGKQSIASTSTLTVSPLSSGNQTSTLHNSQGDTTQHLVMRADGTFISSLAISSPTLKKEFDFSPPALLLGDPAEVGASWSWHATSTDGSTTVTATNKVLRTESVTIGGQSIATVVLSTHLVITDKGLTYTADETNWVAPSLRLPVKTHTVGHGSYGAFTFDFDVTDLMRSLHPGA